MTEMWREIRDILSHTLLELLTAACNWGVRFSPMHPYCLFAIHIPLTLNIQGDRYMVGGLETWLTDINIVFNISQCVTKLYFKIWHQWPMKMAVFWFVAPCSLIEVYWRFRGACCSHHCHDDTGSSTSKTSAMMALMMEAASTSETLVNF
jgi:hypothetical protein